MILLASLNSWEAPYALEYGTSINVPHMDTLHGHGNIPKVLIHSSTKWRGVERGTCSGGAQACVLYTMRSSATESTCPGEKQGSAFSPAISTPAAAAASLTCRHSQA